MKTAAVLLFALFSLTALAEVRPQSGLTAIERSSCSVFPKALEIDKLRPNFDYDFKFELIERSEPCWSGCRYWDVSVKLYYYYRKVTVTDYYTREGKLVTSKTETKRYSLDHTNREIKQLGNWNHAYALPLDEVAKEQARRMLQAANDQGIEILQQMIYRGDLEACSDSYYH